ncbi:hypothetical protein BDA96_01G055700 [Sorghum bicolor]|jgi:hypothetical protein|uniref:Uncharacterized protein n=2 Tax=Sorghum bicolor TaxID=4558 RepID=A0A921RXQ4_SORBI|nr:hypothetical protein BDA96_01G055700 [Sorghum bicolor]KXG37349.1 hypothetical protein SORBI_3001G054400 [Sorghum bicolor]
MRSSTLTVVVVAAAVAVLASGGVAVAARPVVVMRQEAGGSSATGAVLDRVVVSVAVELTSTNSSAQPSNCTYGNNSGGVCPPNPPAPGVGH